MVRRWRIFPKTAAHATDPADHSDPQLVTEPD